MNWLRKSLGVVAVGATVTLAGTACEDNESMLFIVGVLDVERSDCVARAEADSTIKSGGVLDVSLRGGYRAALLIGSQLTQRGSREQLRTETARFALQGAEVTLTDTSGAVLDLGGDVPNPYSTIGTGFVNPSGSAEAGYGVMFADIVPAGLNIPDQTIVSRVRAFGTTLGGTELESNELIFQIQVCRGCLITYPSSAADPDRSTPDHYFCSSVSDEEAELSSCFPGQDLPVPCTFCSASNDACDDPCQNCSVRERDPRCNGTTAPEACPCIRPRDTMECENQNGNQ